MRSHYVTGEHLLVRLRAHPSVLATTRLYPSNLVLWAAAAGFISGVLSSYALPEKISANHNEETPRPLLVLDSSLSACF